MRPSVASPAAVGGPWSSGACAQWIEDRRCGLSVDACVPVRSHVTRRSGPPTPEPNLHCGPQNGNPYPPTPIPTCEGFWLRSAPAAVLRGLEPTPRASAAPPPPPPPLPPLPLAPLLLLALLLLAAWAWKSAVVMYTSPRTWWEVGKAGCRL